MDHTLPAECFARIPSTNEVVIICRGESWHFTVGLGERDIEWVDRMNAQSGITPAQREAMLVGSLFGWDVEGAYVATQVRNGLSNEVGSRNQE